VSDRAKIGLIASINAAQQTDQAPTVASARAAARAINSAGGIAGHEIEIVACSDEYSLAGAGAAAHRMIDEDVIAVTGSSIFDAGIQPVLARVGIPQVGWSPNTVHSYTGSNEYLLNSGSMFELFGATCHAARKGAGAIYVSHVDVPAMDTVVGVVRAASSRVGYRFAGSQAIPASADDITSYVEQFASTGADAVVLVLNSNAAVRFVTTAARLGIAHPTYVYTPADLSTVQIAQLGEAARHFVLASGLPPLSATHLAGIRRYHEEVAAECAAGNVDAAPDIQTNVTLLAWLAVHAIALVAPPKERPSAATLTAALNSARDVDVLGIVSSWTPASRGQAPYERVSNSTVFAVAIERGQLTLTPDPPLDVRVAMGL
jgi:ABC-type branched-subunit amino acid transport system substrate-binding protein